MFEFIKNMVEKKSVNYSDLKNINIAYVLSNFPSFSQTFVINEIKWLVDHNYNVKVISFSTPDVPAILDFEVENIRFDEGSTDHQDLMNNLEKILIENNIQLVHTHFVYPVGTLFDYPICEKLNIPYTIFAHAADIFRYSIDKINRISEVSNSEMCKGIFTLGNFHKNYLIQRNVPDDKIIIT